MSTKEDSNNVFAQMREWLKDHKHNYTHTITSGGCETCGYGGYEQDVVDMDALMSEIEDFENSFKKKSA